MKKNNTNFFIAGGMGLVGRNLAELLIKKKIPFVASYYKKKPPKNLMKFYKKFNFLNFEDCLIATKKLDRLIICAVVGSNVKSMTKDPAKDLVKNITIRANLLRAAYINKVKKMTYKPASRI